jgi:predicted DNA repair protein MutK
MSTGLLALLDDIAALVKVTAATLDDIPAQVAKTSGKVSGIVIDDAAVTPKYVVGLDPSRELSIIYQIARKSLINKVLFLGPATLALGFFAPWVIQPLLMLGGAYLCFEGYEKVHSMFTRHAADAADLMESMEIITPEELENIRVKSAVRTDFILSAEIIAITYATVADKELLTQLIVMLCVAVAITVAVYGFVGLIVKADDVGVHMARKDHRAYTRKIGRGIVKSMPHFLTVLGYIGTAAMLWVGAEIIIHGVAFLHHGLEKLLHAIYDLPGLRWLAKVSICAAAGLLLGGMVERLVRISKIFRAP